MQHVPFVLSWCLTAQLAVLAQTPAPAPVDVAPVDPALVTCDVDALRQAAQDFAGVVGADRPVLGAVVLVARGGRCVLHEAFGFRDVAGELPMAKDTLFRMASNTKAVTAAAVLALVDDGKLALDDPVSKWLPSFGRGAGEKITVRHLLTHTSGLRIDTLFVQPLLQRSAENPDAPSLVLEAARFGDIGPEVEPGTSYRYSNPGYNTLAAIVEIASGQGFADFCRQRFYGPLGMSDSCHHETVADNARMAEVVKREATGRWRVVWRPGGAPTVPFVRGSGGMISTATDYARFCRMLLDGGRCQDVQLLSTAMAAEMTRSQTRHLEQVRYGFGWRIESDGVFSHGGSDGTWVWCDPTRDLVGMVLTQTQGGDELTAARQRFRVQVTAACAPR